MRLSILLFACLVAMPALARQDADPSVEIEPPNPAEPEQTETVESPVEPFEFEWLRERGYDTVVCPFRSRIDYEPGEIQCGLIQVPENREVEGSRTIELHFVHIAARGEDEDGNQV